MYSNNSYWYGKKNYDELLQLLDEVITCGETLLDEEGYSVDFHKDNHVEDDAWPTQDAMMMAMNKTSVWLESDEAKQMPSEKIVILFKRYDRCRRLSELYLNDLFNLYHFRNDN